MIKKRKSIENNPDSLDSTDAQQTSALAKRTKEDSVCHLFSIPDNVAQITLGSYLNTQHIARLSRTCKQYRDLFRSKLQENMAKWWGERDITKTRAKEEYLLNDKDLQDIPVIKRLNPLYRSSYPMCLYKRKHLITACIKKYGSMDNLQKERDSRLAKKEKRGKTMQVKAQHLESRLVEHNLSTFGDWIKENDIANGDFLQKQLRNLPPHISTAMIHVLTKNNWFD